MEKKRWSNLKFHHKQGENAVPRYKLDKRVRMQTSSMLWAHSGPENRSKVSAKNTSKLDGASSIQIIQETSIMEIMTLKPDMFSFFIAPSPGKYITQYIVFLFFFI